MVLILEVAVEVVAFRFCRSHYTKSVGGAFHRLFLLYPFSNWQFTFIFCALRFSDVVIDKIAGRESEKLAS